MSTPFNTAATPPNEHANADPDSKHGPGEPGLPQTPRDQSTEEADLYTPQGHPGTRAGEGSEDPAPDAGGPPPAPSENSMQQQLLASENRVLRAYADLDNYKKRFDRELARQRDTERERFLNGILAVADNLRRALKVDNAEASPYREGLMSVMRQVDNMMRDFGVQPIAAERGQQMDPNYHEALTTLNVPGAPHESIIDVVEPGYMMGERVLRPARVVVARVDD